MKSGQGSAAVECSRVFCSVSSLLSHLIGYRLTAGETQAVPCKQPLHASGFFFLFPVLFCSYSFFLSFAVAPCALKNTHSAPCRYQHVANIEIEWHFTLLCLQRIKPLWEESAFLFFSKESVLVKHPLLSCTDIECPKNSFFFFNSCKQLWGSFKCVSHIFKCLMLSCASQQT